MGEDGDRRRLYVSLRRSLMDVFGGESPVSGRKQPTIGKGINHNQRLGRTTMSTLRTHNNAPRSPRRSPVSQSVTIISLSVIVLWMVTLLSTVSTIHRQATTVLSSSSSVVSSTWHNRHDLVHVIQTRFCQFQPNLLHLGVARLELFRSLTIPSMANQTNSEFLWIIRTDPDLAPILKEQLLQSLQHIPSNVLVVTSNQNPEGFRNAISDITPASLWMGDYQLLTSYHSASLTHTLLETRLDADDALSTDTVELLQTTASNDTFTSWKVWCPHSHLEWQYDSPWNANDQRGALLGVQNSNVCITAGLSWAYRIHIDRSKLTVPSNHHKLTTVLSSCNDRKGITNQCRSSIGGTLPLALRGRTPTSAGMNHVLLSNVTERDFPMRTLQQSKFQYMQDQLWESLPTLFGVQSTEVWTVRNKLQADMTAIAQEALLGQCTKGHSCKETSKQVLQELIQQDNAPAQNS